ncbi:KEOPS complex subunit Pcc1 [Methanococcus maripaludis]|uniref:KEOPS complex subunit Pcc1 n=4 Tax=Methanococcus maripaludis TaxID=39152 RepID=A0A8T3W8M6_METMI|nr:hypothetical protein [Methanococcus maripaludis]MDK2928947.1 hypothetical protein [Methanococcus sp.]BAP62794.1 hypothetical protein MMOS7_07080 [Methanococcus maripaludis OS7]
MIFMKIDFEMTYDSKKEIVDSLKVDDIDDGLIIDTKFDNDEIKVNIKTNSVGSLKNILDDFFVNYELAENIVNLKK